MNDKKITDVMLFSNGNIAAFDSGGQVPELQYSAIELWCAYAEALGYDLSHVSVKTPDGLEWRVAERIADDTLLKFRIVGEPKQP